MAEEPKHWSEHPAYEEDDLKIKTSEELEEAKEMAGVARNTEEIDDRVRNVATEKQDVKLQRRSEKQRNKEVFLELLAQSGVLKEDEKVFDLKELVSVNEDYYYNTIPYYTEGRRSTGSISKKGETESYIIAVNDTGGIGWLYVIDKKGKRAKCITGFDYPDGWQGRRVGVKSTEENNGELIIKYDELHDITDPGNSIRSYATVHKTATIAPEDFDK